MPKLNGNFSLYATLPVCLGLLGIKNPLYMLQDNLCFATGIEVSANHKEVDFYTLLCLGKDSLWVYSGLLSQPPNFKPYKYRLSYRTPVMYTLYLGLFGA